MPKMVDEKLLQERLSRFKPEPLIDYDLSKNEPVVEIPMVNENESCIDLAKANYLDMLNNERLKTVSEEYIRKYGVGTCGPRAFYGTTDVHLDLETGLAKFLGTSSCIVYSYGFVAISSSVAAYCKKKDVVFVDKEVCFPIQQGILASKPKVVYFDHNDPESLYREAKKIEETEKHPSCKFLVVEGINWKTGKLCPLPEFVKVAEEFKMRIFLEESYSIGVFGKTGRGLTEHFDVAVDRIDMIFGTLEGAIGSIGGFCAGSCTIIEHQRLAGSGYIFSASLPTYLARVVLESLEIMGEKPQELVAFGEEFHHFLSDTCNFEVVSDPKAPFKVFTSRNIERQRENEKTIHDFCKENDVHFIKRDEYLVINLNVALKYDAKRLEKVYKVLREAAALINKS